MDNLRCKFYQLKYFSKRFWSRNHSNDRAIGCLLEVDVDYPDKLQDLLNDCSLAGEKITVKILMLLNYHSQII